MTPSKQDAVAELRKMIRRLNERHAQIAHEHRIFKEALEKIRSQIANTDTADISITDIWNDINRALATNWRPQ